MRFDLRSVEILVRFRLSQPETHWGQDRFVAALADEAGVTTRTVHLWLAEGMSHRQADRLAVTLGVHPSALWPDWFADLEVAA